MPPPDTSSVGEQLHGSVSKKERKKKEEKKGKKGFCQNMSERCVPLSV
jgi:hypothetical protein